MMITTKNLNVRVRLRRRRAVAVCLLFASGCAAAGGEPEDVGEGEVTAIASSSDAQDHANVWGDGDPSAATASDGSELVDKALLQTCQVGASGCEIFVWRTGMGDQVMKPTSTHLCVLSKVQGNMVLASTVMVHDSERNLFPGGQLSSTRGTHWKLAGLQSQGALEAEAICVPLNRFLTNSGGVKWLSERFAAVAITGSGSCSAQASANTWWGDASTFVAGIRGTFEGSGEAAWIGFGGPTTPSTINARTNHCNSQIQSSAYSFFVGIPGWGRTPRIYCDGECLNQSGEYRVSASNGSTDRVTMAPSTLATCYFTRISGEFNGVNERVRIYPSPPDAFGNAERWILEAKAGAGASASASVRCVQHNQVF